MILGEKDPTRDDLGKQRTRERFAWFPRYLTDGRIIWLARYVETWEVIRLLPLRPIPPSMIDTCWYPDWRCVSVDAVDRGRA